MKRSAKVILVLVGAAALAGCSSKKDYQGQYKSKEDCLKDWGNNAAMCTQQGRMWLGPRYTYSKGRYYSAAGAMIAAPSRSIGNVNIARPSFGGFGSTGAGAGA